MRTLREIWFVARHVYLSEQIALAFRKEKCGNCHAVLRDDGTCGYCDTRRSY